jgi:hypothetical protein
MGEHCRNCDHWDKAAYDRLPDSYAVCRQVEGPDAPLNTLVYVEAQGARLMTRAEFGCVQFKALSSTYELHRSDFRK